MTDGIGGYLSVTQVNEYVRDLLDADLLLQDLWIAGEVSNLHRAASGHIYLTLKDADCQIRCAMWRSWASRQTYIPDSGDQVLAHGHVSVYTSGGAYQFYVDAFQPMGVGQLYVAFERLKARLADEGLFDPETKRPIPELPRCIGVVTSATGAALRDIINVLSRRYPLAEVIVSPSLVQGAEAPSQIVAALNGLADLKQVDVIIVGRGGGSLEDLWAFNDEGVARAIHACPVPVISAVGHETDYTISDFVADLRAPTPSAAAELVAPDWRSLLADVLGMREEMSAMALDRWEVAWDALEATARNLLYRSPERALERHRQGLDGLHERLGRAMARGMEVRGEQLRARHSLLETLNPLAALGRGYALVRRLDDGRLVRSEGDVVAGDGVNIQVRDGSVRARVE
jgi:exodeoxyribonuclease VII large subunit